MSGLIITPLFLLLWFKCLRHLKILKYFTKRKSYKKIDNIYKEDNDDDEHNKDSTPEHFGGQKII